MDIHLRFINSDSLIAKAIDTVTWSAGGEWSHCEFILDDGYLGSQAPQGVDIRPLDYCKPISEFRCKVSVPDEVGLDVLTFAMNQRGKSYNYAAVAGVAVHSDLSQSDTWDCVQLVAYSFAQAGFPLLRTNEFNRLTPSVLSLSPYLEVLK